VVGAVLISRLLSPLEAEMLLPDNAGAGGLLTNGRTLVAVFQDGQVAAWDWNAPARTLWRFSAESNRVVMLDDVRAASAPEKGDKALIVYDVRQGGKLSQIPIAWSNQDVWLIQSPDKKVLAPVRISAGSEGLSLYEFMTFDLAAGNPGLPVPFDVPAAEKRLIAFAVSNDKKFLAAGSVGQHGLLILADLEQSKIVLEKEYDQADEFTSAAFTPDGSLIFLTNRNGSVYGVNAASGLVESTYTVLKPGQKNPVTNETSSQNITISSDGRYVAAVVINKVHIWEIRTGDHIFQQAPGHKLTGPIALSPDSSLLATSDIRSSGLVRIWKVKK